LNHAAGSTIPLAALTIRQLRNADLPITMMDMQSPTRRAFGFLEREFGFSRTHEGPDLVTYTTPSVEVNVRFDSLRSFELGVTVALRDDVATRSAEPPFSLGEVLRTADAPEAARLACV
jgi:hypothetical protein